MLGDREIVLVIGGNGYTQEEAAKLAFHCYAHTRKNLEAGFITWSRLTWPTEFKEKDWIFLALYYIDKVADANVKEAYQEDLKLLKEAVR